MQRSRKIQPIRKEKSLGCGMFQTQMIQLLHKDIDAVIFHIFQDYTEKHNIDYIKMIQIKQVNKSMADKKIH